MADDITIASNEQTEAVRLDAYGRRYEAGSVTEDGYIVSSTPGQLMVAGIVWISAENVGRAAGHGWLELNGATAKDDQLVQVMRRTEIPQYIPTSVRR